MFAKRSIISSTDRCGLHFLSYIEMFLRRSLWSVHWARLFNQGSMHCKSVFSGNLEMTMTLGYTNESIFTRCTFHFFFSVDPWGPMKVLQEKTVYTWVVVDGCFSSSISCLYIEVISCVQNSVTVCALFTLYASLDHIRNAVDAKRLFWKLQKNWCFFKGSDRSQGVF